MLSMPRGSASVSQVSEWTSGLEQDKTIREASKTNDRGVGLFIISIFTGFSQLPGVVQIVPDAIESSRKRGDRIEESISQPDCKDGVFLAERLPCRDSAYPLSYGELQDAGDE